MRIRLYTKWRQPWVPGVVVNLGEWELCLNPIHWGLFRAELESSLSMKPGFYYQFGPFSVQRNPG